MPFANLNPNTSINISEDTRTAKITTTATVTSTFTTPQLTANANRATYSIYNAGPSTVFMKEGITVTLTSHEAVIPAGFFWTPDAAEPRYLGAISLLTATGTATVQISDSSLIVI